MLFSIFFIPIDQPLKMNSLLLSILFLALAISSVLCYKTNTLEFAKKINNLQTTWKAEPNHMTQGSVKELKKMLGSRLDKTRFLPVKPEKRMLSWNIPDSFDARTKWPMCTTINSIKDQSNCGSCWAVAAASCMSDRLCIASKGSINVNISAQQILSCCSYCGDGCQGGYSEEAWAYAYRTGVVSGGDYGSNEGCQPYEISPCNIRHNLGLPSCANEEDTPSCHRSSCTNTYSKPFNSDIHKFRTPYRVSSTVISIQAEIMERGPVEASFNVYMDFNYYKSGVYQYTYGKTVGGHAVRIIGWGKQNGIDYWLCANTWTHAWGENGFFKIARGTNECGIEDYIVAGQPIV